MIEYTRRRTILELALAGAKARGLLQLGPLVLDRPARYFDDFRRLTKGTGESWPALCAAAGLIEGQDNPDVLVSREGLRPPGADASRSDNERDRPDTQALNRFDPKALAQHVMVRVKNANSNDDVLMGKLRDTFEEIQKESEIELHMRDDRVCSKAFRRPMTLPTATSLEAYTRLLLNRISEGDHVYISSETADWMLREDFRPKLERAYRIHLLLAFDTKREALSDAYGEKLKVTTIDPWRHSRHMRMVCKGETPERAIYFARRARNPVITAVYLNDISDVLLLHKLYDERWRESDAEEQHRKSADGDGDNDK